MKRTMFTAVVAAMLCSNAFAVEPLTSCQTTLIAHGVIFRGATVCNPSWLDRGGSHILLLKAQACNQTKNAKAYMERGFKDFDRKSAEVGMVAACESVNKHLSALSSD